MRAPAQPFRRAMQRRRPARVVRVTAPVNGLVRNRNLTRADPLSASVMENWFPTLTGARVRRGALRHATIGANPVRSLFSYRSATVEKLFAADAAAIFDVTTPADASVAPAASLSQMTGGEWCSAQIATTGGDFLLAVNGADRGVIYDGTGLYPWGDVAVTALDYDAASAGFTVGETVTGGTSGASAPIIGVKPTTATTGTLYLGTVSGGPFQDDEAITDGATGSATADGAGSVVVSAVVSGVATSALSALWVHKSRVWAVQKNTLVAWYLPAASIGGTATSFALRGVFRDGGSLLFGATISGDSGDGMDDRAVFVSDQGEVAVYQGTDPASASTWALVGVYRLGGRPMGRKAWMRAGGDIVIACENGLVPLSEAMTKDPAVLDVAAISQRIEDLWRETAEERPASTWPWEIARDDVNGWAMVAAPTSATVERRNLVVNTATGRWAVWTGWDARCLGVLSRAVYYGSGDGRVLRTEAGGRDDGATYECRLAQAFNDFGAPGATKTIQSARMIALADGAFLARLSASRDYTVSFPAAPGVAAIAADNTWGTAVFDTATWGGGDPAYVETQWQSIGRTARAAAIQVQVTVGSGVALGLEVQAFDVLVDQGAFLT